MGRLRTVWTAVLAGTLLAGSMHVGHAPADSGGLGLEESQVSELREFFDEASIPDDKRESLLQKLDQGEIWDSFSEVEPVNSDSVVIGGQLKTIDRYPDGSATITVIDLPDPASGGVGPAGISGCVLVSGSAYHANYEGCHAVVNRGVVEMGFYYNTATNPGVLGRITSYYGNHHYIIGGALSGHRFSKFSDQQVRYSADFSVAFESFPIGWTAWMQVTLGIGSAASTQNN